MSCDRAALQSVADELLQRDDFVICGHISPDGDCLGSQLALALALRSLGKSVQCILAKDEPVEFGLRFMPGLEDMIPAKRWSGAVSTFVAVDVPHAGRLGFLASQLHAKADFTITIDHHRSDEPMSDVNYVDSGASAAALIIWQLIELLGVTPTTDMATCAYVGLMTDTGRFQFQNTDVDTFVAASAMVQAGAHPADIAREVYQNRSRASFTLEQLALERMETFGENDEFLMTYLMLSDFKECSATKSDAEPLVNVIRTLRGTRVVCILREQSKGVRGSLRAKDDTDVAAIASEIGGGGHKAAAGFTFDGDMDGARRCIRGYFEALSRD